MCSQIPYCPFSLFVQLKFTLVKYQIAMFTLKI